MENLRATQYASSKFNTERFLFFDQKNQMDHGDLFWRVEQLEEAVGPTLGSAGSIEALVAEGEARVKRQGDLAVDNLFLEEKMPLSAWTKKPLPMRKISRKRWPKSLTNEPPSWKFRSKGPWKIGVWKV